MMGRLVTVVRGLYERFRQLIHEAAKFGVVGIVGVLITNGGYALLHTKFGMGPVSATTIATIIATAVSYVANRYWSFRHRERTSVAREGTIFFVLNGIGLLIQDAVVAFNFYILGYGHNKAAECAIDGAWGAAGGSGWRPPALAPAASPGAAHTHLR